MTPEQQKIVEANMGLVGKVIKEKVRRLGQPGTPSYEDLFQTGCVGLCKAAMTDKGGCFSTYAYRLIWNEICDELIRNTRLVLNEQSTDTVDVLSEAASAHPDPLTTSDLRHTIGQAKAKAQGGTARGIQCLELTVQGYTSKEIGAIVGADPGTVRMWITRARKYLKGLPELERVEFVGLCTDICVITNAMMTKGALPEVPLFVRADCCAGVTPESHETALNAMKMCQIKIV